MPGIVTRAADEMPAPDRHAIVNLLIFRRINNMPRFLATQAEAIAGAGRRHLATAHSQTYPQFLGISHFRLIFAGLARERGERQNGRLLNK
jgi:hypothetical protein